MPNSQNHNHLGGERIARLEEHKEHVDKQIDAITDSMKTIGADVNAIRLQVEKSASFVGGIAFLGASLGAFLLFLAQIVAKKLGWV